MSALLSKSRVDRLAIDAGNQVWIVAAIVLAVRMYVAPLKRTTLSAYERGCEAWWQDSFYYEQNLDYIYPPTFTVAYSPLGWLPDWLGGPLWALLGLGVAWLGLKAFLRHVIPNPLSAKQESLVMGLALFGLFRGIWAAQANALVIGLALWAISAVVRKQWWSAGFCLVAPIYVKLWPAALAMLIVPLKARPLAGRVLVAIAALGALPWLTRSWDIVWRQHVGYADLILHRRLDSRFGGYRDLWTIWEQFQTPDPQLYKLLQLATAGCVFGWCLWLAWRKESEQRLGTAMLGMWLSWQILIGPGTERLTFGILAPLMAWSIAESIRIGRLRTLSVAAFVLLYVLGTGEVERRLLPYLSWSPAIAPLGPLAFVGWLAVYFSYSPTRATENVVAPPADIQTNRIAA